MIHEVAILDIHPGKSQEFEQAFGRAQSILANMPGYIFHRLQKCLEQSNRYLLLVDWQILEDHTLGFRTSDQHQEWKTLLHQFYDPFPTVEHYAEVQL